MKRLSTQNPHIRVFALREIKLKLIDSLDKINKQRLLVLINDVRTS